jgi:hypothetical protein
VQGKITEWKICQPVGHFNVIAPVIAEEKLCWIWWNGAELQGPFESAVVFSQTDPLQMVLHRFSFVFNIWALSLE